MAVEVHASGRCGRCGKLVHIMTIGVDDPEPLCRWCTADDAPSARIHRAPWWRRAIAWVRCLMWRRRIESQIESQDAINARRARELENAARMRRVVALYPKPPQTRLPGPGVPQLR